MLRQNWMSPALLKSLKTKDRLYKKSMGKSKESNAYKIFIPYRNQFNKLKKIAKQNNYKEKLTMLVQNRYPQNRKTWTILKTIAYQNKPDKTSISDMFKIGNNISKRPPNYLKHILQILHRNRKQKKYAANIPQAQKPYSCHLQNKNIKHSLFMTPTDPMEIVKNHNVP